MFLVSTVYVPGSIPEDTTVFALMEFTTQQEKNRWSCGVSLDVWVRRRARGAWEARNAAAGGGGAADAGCSAFLQ